MLDIVVYGNKKNFIFKSISCIKLSLSNFDVDYHIHEYDKYTSELDYFIRYSDSKKIYILDDEVNGVSGLEIATKIRKYDWDSVIILLIKDYKNVSEVLNLKLMILDLIPKDNVYENRLIDNIKMAISIIYGKKMFTFRYNYVVYRIPYNQICYIEKELSVKRCIIHTILNEYYINSSMNSLLSQLSDNFCRTHQSCIVNLDNIREVDLGSNIIVFNNGDRIDMLTVKKKKIIKEYFGLFE